MSTSLSINAIVLVLAAALSARGQQQATVVTPRLANFHAKSPDQQVKARLFDDPIMGPLKPNTVRVESNERAAPPHSPPDYATYLRRVVCQADLVALDRPSSQETFVTDTESSIFTDYVFRVDQWLRGTASTEITVTLRGGKINTDDGPIEVEDEDLLTLGGQYVVFLKPIPNTSSYLLNAPTVMAGTVAKSMKAKRDVPPALLHGDKATATVLADLRNFARSCGSQGGVKHLF